MAEATVSWKDYTDALLAEHRHAKQIIIERLTAELASSESLQKERIESVRRDLDETKKTVALLTSRVDTAQGRTMGVAGVIGWMIGVISLVMSAFYYLTNHKS